MKELTFHRQLLHAAHTRATDVAFVDRSVPEAVGVHVERSLRLADGLGALGVRPGDRVVVVAHASRFVANILHACAFGGTIGIPMNGRTPAPELAELIDDCTPAVIFCDEAHVELVTATLRLTRCQPCVVLIDDGVITDGSRPTLAALVADGAPNVPPEPDEDTALLMIYTGGTTGRSKGAVCDNRRLMLALNRKHRQFECFTPGMATLSTNPLFHITGIPAVYAFPAAGNTVVMRPTFVPEEVLADAAVQPITHLPAATAVLQRLLDHPDFTPRVLGHLRYVIYGGSAMPLPVLHRLLDTFPGVCVQQVYGMTEVFGAACVLGGPDHLREETLLSSVGRPMPGVLVEIRGPDGAAVPDGTVGEVCVSSGSAIDGYWGTTPLDTGDWFRTGDLGRRDDEGYVYLVDRLKDMIISGSENVYSAEVERVLQTHPSIESVAVVGVPDAQWGERVHAVVVPVVDADLTAEDVIAFARERLTGFKAPKTVDVRCEPLPLSSLGKVLKRTLRAQYAGS